MSLYYEQTHKPSLGLKLLTKFSLPSLASSHSNLSSPVTPSYPSHPYSASFSARAHAHPYGVCPDDRSITPEEDPFRRDEIASIMLATPRLTDSSPRSGSLYDDCEAYEQSSASCSAPILSSRWSSDSDSLPSPKHAPAGRPLPASSLSRNVLRTSPSQGHSTSLTFPLPPSAQKSHSLPGVTVRVTTPNPGPPPAYPLPPTPPPFGPLPRLPPAGTFATSRVRSSGRVPKESSRRRLRRDSTKLISKSTSTGQIQRRRSQLRMDKSSPPLAPRSIPASSRLEEHLLDSPQRTYEKLAPRRRDRPSSPFPFPLLATRARQDPTGRLEALRAATRFADPWKDSIICQFDQSADAFPDSEVEPDRDFDVSYNVVH
jgi:hypothetical protein